MGPLLPDPGPRNARWARRAKGIAVETVAFGLVTLAFPFLLGAAAAVDLVRWALRRRPWVGVRLVAMAWWFLFGELRGVAGLALAGLASGGRDTRRRRFRVYRLRQQWAGGHLDGVARLFGLRFEVEGLGDVAPGPVLILMRHASIIDNTLPDALVGRTHGLGLRFVIKRELQVLPTIDIGGRWVPTNFVRRGSGDTAGELLDLRRLAIDLDPHEGVLIYPEGTRHTPAKLLAAQEAIARSRPDIAPLAAGLHHVLPPRLGGAIALLEEARGTDVVFCGHVGLDGFEHIADIWSGALVGRTVRVRFWRHPAASVPAERDELVRWLYAQWQVLDDWVGEHREA
ncbi:lysophospholipid acyltransferase family protein [Baekduia soli]|uniref:lysophospholipid acyltransferase family protein n=1 Tax=Baekduia soli TaxID=496014 RepID=UPI001652882E|nr:lysophospholipid acyltransferase family protein [Baekduia soli]